MRSRGYRAGRGLCGLRRVRRRGRGWGVRWRGVRGLRGRRVVVRGRLRRRRRVAGFSPWAVVRDRARGEPSVGQSLVEAFQVAVTLQLPHGARDPQLALGELGGQGLDADGRPCRQGLEVDGEPDGKQGELAVLGEVVADDRVAGRVPDVDVNEPGGAAGRARLLGIHREGVASSLVRPSIGSASPGRGPTYVWVVGVSICQATSPKSSPVGTDHPCE